MQLQQLDYNNENGMFSVWSVPRNYLEDNWSHPVSCQLRVKFCTRGCENRTWAQEAEESPLLETVASERLMKRNRLEEGLAGAVVTCEVLRSAIAM
jgi:hypothetical protein